jgi:hypothetical protein
MKLKVFDWIKAATLIRSTRPRIAEAGLSGNWGVTCTTICRRGEIERNHDGHLASHWATPTILLIDDHGHQTWIDCYVMSSETEWNESTRWPAEALAELHAVDGVACDLSQYVSLADDSPCAWGHE